MIRLAETIAGLAGWRRSLAVLAAGAMAGLALPPFGLWPVLAPAFVLFLVLLEKLPRGKMAMGFRLGRTFGFGYFLVAFHWIGFAFFVDAATYLWMMPFAVCGLAAGMAIYWGLAAMAAQATGFSGLRLVMGFAALLAIAEWLRGHLLTGFPWAAPGLVVDGMGGLAQWASVFGMTGLTALILLWAGLPLCLKGSIGEKRLGLALLALLPLLWGLGAWRLAGAEHQDVPGVSLRLVQPAIAQDEKWREDNARQIFDTLLGLSDEATAANPEGIGSRTHVLWPESAVPFLIDESPVAKEELARLLSGRTVLITGAIRRDGSAANAPYHNSIITFDGHANVAARYDKWRLVPGGEFLPLAWLLEPLGFRRVVTVPADFTAGPGPVSVSVQGAPAAAMIVCYEAIFPHALIDPARRPGWIVNLTNDGWFDGSTGPAQHFAQARLRAIEQGLPMVRVANTGISGIVDPYGEVKTKMANGERGVIDSSLPAAIAPPLYARYVDLGFAILVSVLLLFATISGVRR